MSGNTSDSRRQLLDDYRGALIRLATLRANKQQYLLFAWVELYPFDMRLPDRWISGEQAWRVPQSDGWTCAFSATPVTVTEALDWYEAAANGNVVIHVGKSNTIEALAPAVGPEPAYGGFCTGVDAPFALSWHDDPRVHRYVALSANPEPVRQLGLIRAAREWLEQHIGFDPYEFDEWLGGLALLAPDPLCAAVALCLTGRTEDGRESLTVQVVPRRSVERGIAHLSDLSIHVVERRVGAWQSVRTMQLNPAGTSVKIENPHWYGEVGYALVCPKRGLLRFVEPQSSIEQVGIGMHASNMTLMVDVPAEGRRKPAKTIPVMRFLPRLQISVGAALNDAVRTRLIAAKERRKMRLEISNAPQRLFGSQRSVTDRIEVQRQQQEAESFVAGLIARAQKQVIFVDPFFGLRQTRLFALRVSNNRVRVRILTGQQGLKARGESRQPPHSLLAADLAYLESLAKDKSVVAPTVRVMLGGDTPAIHDRYLVVDNEVWHCGPSFNELGARLGVMVRLPDPIAVRREINAVWSQSTRLEELSAKRRPSLLQWISSLWGSVRSWVRRS
jgi:hypothetical protein